MIYPIVAYGDPVLRKEADDIPKDFPKLDEFIADMWETMYKAKGLGLAAPQIGESIRVFIIDATPFGEDPDEDDDPKEVEFLKDFKRVFINPIIVEEEGDEWAFKEGCLSIPDIHEEVFRQERITMEYYDENWEFHTESFYGYAARVIQHEYDHIEGILFTDHLTALKRRLMKRKLQDISKGDIDVHYRMRFPALKKGR